MNDDDFQQVLDRVERNKSNSTAAAYLPKIRDFREWLDGKQFEDADVIDVENWLADLDERYNNSSTVGVGQSALVAAYTELNKLINAGRVNGEGWRDGETPPDRASYTPSDTRTYKAKESREDLEYLTPDEVDAMANEAERLRDELIIRLFFQTGMRVSELVDIRWPADVDLDNRSINIQGKGRKNRTVFYQPSLDLLFDVWVNEHRPAVYYAEESDYLFPTSHSPQIITDTVQSRVREAAERAGLQEEYGENVIGRTLHSVTPHVLRHSFAMAALANDWDVFTLSQALGHESTEITTSTYLHEDEKAVRRAFNQRPVSSSD